MPVYYVTANIETNLEADSDIEAMQLMKKLVGTPRNPQTDEPMDVDFAADENPDHRDLEDET